MWVLGHRTRGQPCAAVSCTPKHSQDAGNRESLAVPPARGEMGRMPYPGEESKCRRFFHGDESLTVGGRVEKGLGQREYVGWGALVSAGESEKAHLLKANRQLGRRGWEQKSLKKSTSK